ncbi:MAG: Holliday junction branch migration protein RuvA [Gammaproteobacteria bacterium]|nr:Holliday junction branch migration protein RuvA [Gammaproteobacteria bacterium]
MIGYLRGRILSCQPPQLLLDVNGIGYEIEATMATFGRMPEVGAEFGLYTHLIVREDAQLLYGFASDTERSLFRSLIRITGVGARMALTVLSGMSVADFTRCILDKDVAMLTRLPGVGKKTAERLIVEMHDRLPDSNAVLRSAVLPGARAAAALADPVADAVSALISLGYKPQEASRMVRAVETEGQGSAALIRAALQSVLAKG